MYIYIRIHIFLKLRARYRDRFISLKIPRKIPHARVSRYSSDPMGATWIVMHACIRVRARPIRVPRDGIP